MKTALIVCGGMFSEFDKSFYKADFIVACDKGYEYCQKLNINPDLIVGDFDSYKGEIPSEINSIRLPHEKDDTDTLFAVKKALEEDCDDFTFVCALGNRVDHQIANIQTLQFLAEKKCNARIISENETLICIKNSSIKLPARKGFSLSVFSLTDESTGVSEKGTGYDIENATLKSTFPIGISNEWKSEEAEISVKNGVLLIVESRI